MSDQYDNVKKYEQRENHNPGGSFIYLLISEQCLQVIDFTSIFEFLMF